MFSLKSCKNLLFTWKLILILWCSYSYAPFYKSCSLLSANSETDWSAHNSNSFNFKHQYNNNLGGKELEIMGGTPLYHDCLCVGSSFEKRNAIYAICIHLLILIYMAWQLFTLLWNHRSCFEMTAQTAKMLGVCFPDGFLFAALCSQTTVSY